MIDELSVKRSEKSRICDCVGYCGDDPWLKTGKADPCEAYHQLHNTPEHQVKTIARHERYAERLAQLREAGLGFKECLDVLRRSGDAPSEAVLRGYWKCFQLVGQ